MPAASSGIRALLGLRMLGLRQDEGFGILFVRGVSAVRGLGKPPF